MLEKTKNLMAKAETKAAAVAASIAAAIGIPVSCDVNVSTVLNNILNIVWTLLTFGGIVFIALGAVNVFRAVSSGDQADPHALGKGIGQIVGGIVMVAVKSVLGILGVPTTVSL